MRTYDGYSGAAAQARALTVRRRLAREERAAAVVTDAQLRKAEAWWAASYGPPGTRFPRFN